MNIGAGGKLSAQKERLVSTKERYLIRQEVERIIQRGFQYVFSAKIN